MKKSAKMKVMRIHYPGTYLWFKGFVDGRILHTGGIDPQTNTVYSPFITGQLELFQGACATCRGNAERKLKKEWDEADSLLIDLEGSTGMIESGNKAPFIGEGNEEDRDGIALLRAREQRKEHRNKKLKRLSEIANTIRSEYDGAISLMESTDAALMNAFATYGHGLLLKPVYSYNLPNADYNVSIEEFFKSHRTTWNGIMTLLKEV